MKIYQNQLQKYFCLLSDRIRARSVERYSDVQLIGSTAQQIQALLPPYSIHPFDRVGQPNGVAEVVAFPRSVKRGT